MPKFKVRVTVKAECSYEVEVEAADEDKAEREAENKWRTALPGDFEVEKGYVTDWETEAEQLTWECEECSAPLTEKQYRSQDELCLACLRVSAAVA